MKPFDRLKFWGVAHELIHRLKPYDVSIPHLSVFRGQSFSSLRVWAMLLDEDDDGLIRSVGIDPDQYIPTPEEWFGKVEV